MLLLNSAGLGALVANDEVHLYRQVSERLWMKQAYDMYLGTGAGKIGTEHDNPWCRVREFLAGSLETVFEELEVATTAVTALLVLHFVLDNQGLLLEVDGLSKGCRNSVVGGLALCNETLVALNEGARRVFDRPLTDIAEGLAADGGLLRCLRRCPPARPVIRELFKEGCLDSSTLYSSTGLEHDVDDGGVVDDVQRRWALGRRCWPTRQRRRRRGQQRALRFALCTKDQNEGEMKSCNSPVPLLEILNTRHH